MNQISEKYKPIDIKQYSNPSGVKLNNNLSSVPAHKDEDNSKKLKGSQPQTVQNIKLNKNNDKINLKFEIESSDDSTENKNKRESREQKKVYKSFIDLRNKKK